MGDEDAAQRSAAQAGMVERLMNEATRVLDTSGSEEATKALVESALDEAIAARR